MPGKAPRLEIAAWSGELGSLARNILTFWQAGGVPAASETASAAGKAAGKGNPAGAQLPAAVPPLLRAERLPAGR